MKPTSHLVLQRAALSIILIAFILAGVLYALSTPFLDVSDEVRHYAMVEQLALGLGLPVQDPAHHGFYEQEGSQPPLYYALMSLVAAPFDRSDFMQLAQFNPHARLGRADATNNWNQLIHTPAESFPWHGTVLVVMLIRLLGVLMGAVTVACTFALARELAPDQPWAWFVAPLAAAFTAFNPMFVFISSSVNNDTLAAMLSSLGVVLGVRIIKTRLTWRNAALLGLVLAGAALTKSSALALVVVLPLVILLSEWLRLSKGAGEQGSRGAAELGNKGERTSVLPLTPSPPLPSSPAPLLRPLPQLALTGVLVAGLAGWWYARNAYLYHGDFTGTNMMATIAGARDRLPSLGELLGEWGGFRQAYWGLFGAVNIPMSRWIYSVFDTLLILAGIGLVLWAGDAIRQLRANRKQPADCPDGPWPVQAIRLRVLPVLACLGAFGVALVALVHWTSITLASQGRLLFPVIAVISAFTALGLCRLAGLLLTAGTRQAFPVQQGIRATLVVIPVLMAVLTFACPFAYIRPSYATPSTLPNEAQLPSNLQKTELRFADTILWLGYTVDTPRVKPGDEFDVTLYWQPLKPMSTNYSAFIRLYGRTDNEVFLLDTYPGGGMYQTSLWQPGQTIADHYHLRIEDTITTQQEMPTALQLDVGFWDYQTKQFLTTSTPDGSPTGRLRYEAGALAWPGTPPATHYPALSQAQVSQTQTSLLGNSLTFTITWAATADFGEDYTVFAHLFDANGQKVTQADGRASKDHFSARWWRKGDVIVDPHTFTLPEGLPKGNYTIKFGLYKPTDGSRMPAFDAQGQLIDDAALSVPVTIQ
jgi:hypothetical protein